jgi:hypothetical protein
VAILPKFAPKKITRGQTDKNRDSQMMSCVLSKKSSNWQMSLLPMGEKHKTLIKILARLFAFVFTCLHGRCVRESRRPFAQGFFFCGEFRHLATKKKKALANPTNGVLRIVFFILNIRHISRKKKVKSRQI